MTKNENARKLQQLMKEAGFYTGIVDGLWGSKSAEAHAAYMLSITQGTVAMSANYDIAWSNKVSPEFVAKVKKMVVDLKMTYPGAADDFMSCMAFETGETFSPTIKNGAGAPYYGLIQFGAAAAKDCGTTIEALLKMTAEEQLDYVYKFFKPYAGKLQNLGDLYMRILWPRAVGKDDSYVLFIEGEGKAYLQNKGLDVDKDGKITRAECLKKINEKKVRGMDISRRRPLM